MTDLSKRDLHKEYIQVELSKLELAYIVNLLANALPEVEENFDPTDEYHSLLGSRLEPYFESLKASITKDNNPSPLLVMKPALMRLLTLAEKALD